MAVIILIIPIVILALLAVAAQVFGVDSRVDSTDPRSPERGIATR